MGIRQRLIDAIAPVRSLLVAVSGLPWQATGEHPVLDALGTLRVQYGVVVLFVQIGALCSQTPWPDNYLGR